MGFFLHFLQCSCFSCPLLLVLCDLHLFVYLSVFLYFYNRTSNILIWPSSCQRSYQKVTHNDGLSMRRKVSTHLDGALQEPRGGGWLPFGEFHASLNHGPNVLCIIFIANNFLWHVLHIAYSQIYTICDSAPFGLLPIPIQLRFQSSCHSIAFHLAKCIVKNVLCIKCNRKI